MGVSAVLQGFGVPAGRIEELNWLDKASITAHDGSELCITAVPSRHFSGRSLFNRNETLWTSYALRGQRHGIYYGADSGLWDGFPAIAEQFGPFDLTMLEIGAFDPLWSDIHMGPEGAVRSFRALGSRGLLMPIHWGLFDLALHPWTGPIESVFAEKDLKLWSPTPGVPSEVVRERELRSTWWQ